MLLAILWTSELAYRETVRELDAIFSTVLKRRAIDLSRRLQAD